MIRLPDNVDQIRHEKMTLRFASDKECGYRMLTEAGAAGLANRLQALEYEAQYAAPAGSAHRYEDEYAPRSMADIEADKNAAIEALRASRVTDGDGQFCVLISVDEAIRSVQGLEAIRRVASQGVDVQGFSAQEVARSATDMLERFEQNIAQIAQAAAAVRTQEHGMFPPAPVVAPAAGDEAVVDAPSP